MVDIEDSRLQAHFPSQLTWFHGRLYFDESVST